MLRGFLVLCGFFVAGEAVRVLLALPVSGGVLGMLALTFLLMLRGTISDSLAGASQALIGVLVLLIMPGVVGVFFQAGQFAGEWLAIVAALLAGTFLSVLTTLWVMRKMVRQPAGAASGD